MPETNSRASISYLIIKEYSLTGKYLNLYKNYVMTQQPRTIMLR